MHPRDLDGQYGPFFLLSRPLILLSTPLHTLEGSAMPNGGTFAALRLRFFAGARPKPRKAVRRFGGFPRWTGIIEADAIVADIVPIAGLCLYFS